MDRSSFKRLAIVLVAVAWFMAPRPLSAQQAVETRYVHDDNGRLTAVVSPTGEAVVYDYDLSGNITAIRRIGADTLSLLAFSPTQGAPGDRVTFVGTGFNLGVTSVSFNGAPAFILAVTPSYVIAEVPEVAITGPVTLTTPRGSVTTTRAFVIVNRLRLIPSDITVLPGESVVFTATAGPGESFTLIWSVNGIVGGNGLVGTISQEGVYVAPSTFPGNAAQTVVVRATRVDRGDISAAAQVRILNPDGLAVLIAPRLSVTKGGFLELAGIRGLQVSVRKGVVVTGQGSILSPMVSVSNGPDVSNVTPNQLSRGASVLMIVTGGNLGSATSLEFVDANGRLDSTITASGIVPEFDGSSLQANVTVGSSSAIGQRVVVVKTPAGISSLSNTGRNLISVQ